MSDEKYKAKLDQVNGLKQGLGKVTGNKKLEAEGFVEKTIAKGKNWLMTSKKAQKELSILSRNH